MAHVRKGLLTTPGEWAKHLRKFWKKTYWGKERQAARRDAQRRKDEHRD